MARMPGITTKELMARIGHASPRAVLIYQHATEERDRAIAAFLDEQLASATREKRAPIVAIGAASGDEPRDPRGIAALADDLVDNENRL
jgi:hypothetical protein